MFNAIYQGRRILVTGHTGFKGSWLCQWLLQLNAKVSGFSLDIPTTPALFELLNLQENVDHHVGDVRDYAALLTCCQAVKPDILFHLAAQSLVRESYLSPKTTFDTDSGGTVNVLECIRQCPSIKTAVIVTSDKCYHNDESGVPFNENAKLGGKDPYSASKACAEIISHAYIQAYFNHSGVRLATARAGNVIGGGDWSQDRLVPDLMRALTVKQPLLLRHPQATRPWQHVLEPLSGYLWLGAKLWSDSTANFGAVNFGPNTDAIYTTGDVVKKFKHYFPALAITTDLADQQGKSEATTLQLDSTKAKETLNWQAILNINQRIALTADWYQHHYSNSQKLIAFTNEQIHNYETLATQLGQSWAQ